MIRTKDLIEFVQSNINYNYPAQMDIGYLNEIIKRLRAHDRLCRDLKLMITTLSNGVDE